MIEQLLQPFQFAFMQNAFLIAAIVSIPTAMLSCFLVVRGWALMGDAVSHAVLPGIVLAYVIGLPLILGAFAAGMLTAIATGYLTENSRIKQDTVMGVVFSGMFGAGIVMFIALDTNVHLDHVLFGNMLGIGAEDLWTAGAISAGVMAVLAVKWKDFLLHSFDPAQARVSGLAVGVLHFGLLTILSLMVVAVLSATGLILAIGLLITPGAIAYLFVRSFGKMLILAVVTCMGSMLLGVYLSFHLDAAPAPTIILILSAVFVVAYGYRTVKNTRVTTTVN